MKKEQVDRIVEAVRNMFYPKETFNHEAMSGREVISINNLRTALEAVELDGEQTDEYLQGFRDGLKAKPHPSDREVLTAIDRYLKEKGGER